MTQTKEETKEPKKDLTVREWILKRIDRNLLGYKEQIDEFVERAKESPTQAMRWKGERVMLAEAVSSDLTRLKRAMVEGPLKEDPKLLEALQHQVDRICDDLLGGPFGSSSGPWSGHSTCQFTNLATLAECDAKRTLYALFSDMILALEGKKDVNA